MTQTDTNDSGPFTPGLVLARRYFQQVVEPIVADAAPELRYSAALIGDGSDVLGYDDPISADHDWGPRLLLFLRREDWAVHAGQLLERLDARLPDRFEGWPTRFPDQDRPNGIDAAAGAAGSDHGVELHTLEGWTLRHVGADLSSGCPTRPQWESFNEDRLLSATSGAVFRDDEGRLSGARHRIRSWPAPLRLAKISALWSLAAAEMPFVGRAGDCGDDLGSRVIAARLAELAMRLCFLVEDRYAPYSKWFGTAFAALPGASRLIPHLEKSLSAGDWRSREAALGSTFLAVAQLHLERGVGGRFTPRLAPYFSRPYTVINADEIAEAVLAAQEVLIEHFR